MIRCEIVSLMPGVCFVGSMVKTLYGYFPSQVRVFVADMRAAQRLLVK